jgi:outer membrane protein OmpA-like peptidoglycan-associated protein
MEPNYHGPRFYGKSGWSLSKSWGDRRMLSHIGRNIGISPPIRGLKGRMIPERMPMQRFLNAVTSLSTCLSVAVYVVPPFTPLAAMADSTTASTDAVVVPEGAFTIDLDGKTVICLPDKTVACPDGSFCVIAKVKKGCEAKAQIKMTNEAAKAAAADAATADAATADAAGTAAASTDTAPAVAPTPPPAPAATADAGTATTPDTTAADTTAADTTASPAPADTTPPSGKPADAVAADTAPDATSDTAVNETTVAPAPTPAPAPADTKAADAGAAPAVPQASKTITIGDKQVICLPAEMTVTCPKGEVCVRPLTMANCDVAASKKLAVLAAAAAEDQKAIDAAKAASDAAAKAAEDAGKPLVDAPKPTDEAVKSLDTVIGAPSEPAAATDTTTATPAPVVAAAAAAATTDDGKSPANATPSPDAVVTDEKVTAADTRTSSQEFAAAPATTADGKKKTGLSDLEKAGLVALGALAIGQMLYGNNGTQNEVVSNSGDRVVVKDQSGNYQVYKDDDVLLRQPGANVRTETFSDGSTRTTVKRDDGSSVVTIRDASGRVLRRSAYDRNGIETALINDTIPETHVDVTKLPPATATQAQDNLAVKTYAHQFSLRQIRTISEVRALAPVVKVPNVRFATGSAAIPAAQAANLQSLAEVLQRLIRKNPNRVFLIEGHTDAVGDSASNLTLSDRRAESVAKALIEYYGVPPENLVVQGYGESQLKVDTAGAEPANRRVEVRDITPLLRQAKNL